MKAIGYIRISDKNDRGISLARQLELVTECANRNSITLEEIISEECSGFKDTRKGYVELKRKLIKGGYDAVVIPELSRLSRSTIETLTFLRDVLKKKKIKLYSLQGEVDYISPSGLVNLSIQAVLNQNYRDEISIKTKIALNHKKKRMEYCGGKRPPYGFKLVDGKLEVNEVELTNIMIMRKLRFDGLSYRDIKDAMWGLGIESPTGKPLWGPKTIDRILSRP